MGRMDHHRSDEGILFPLPKAKHVAHKARCEDVLEVGGAKNESLNHIDAKIGRPFSKLDKGVAVE